MAAIRPRLSGIMAVPILALTLIGSAPAAPAWDFDLILDTSRSIYSVNSRARTRLLAWQALVEGLQKAPLETRLEQVNRFFNKQLRFESDQWIWGQADYWATPMESLIQGAADCEDYAIAKYVTLKALGVPGKQLRLIYVKATELGESHMVLAWYAEPSADPLILDNLTDSIVPATSRSDLVPVYSFNASGLWLPGMRADRQVGSSRHLPRWQDVQNKMRREGFPDTGAHDHGD